MRPLQRMRYKFESHARLTDVHQRWSVVLNEAVGGHDSNPGLSDSFKGPPCSECQRRRNLKSRGPTRAGTSHRRALLSGDELGMTARRDLLPGFRLSLSHLMSRTGRRRNVTSLSPKNLWQKSLLVYKELFLKIKKNTDFFHNIK